MFLPLLTELDRFRSYLGLRIVVSCGTQGTHTKDSWHFQGRAVDIIVPEPGALKPLDIWIEASRFAFTGIGLYRDWQYNGKRTGGFHLEIAPAQPVRKLWLCTSDDAGNQQYFPFSQETLAQFQII